MHWEKTQFLMNTLYVCLKKSLLAERLMLRGALVSVLFSLFRIYLPRSWEEIQIELRLRVQLDPTFILGCKKVILTPTVPWPYTAAYRDALTLLQLHAAINISFSSYSNSC